MSSPVGHSLAGIIIAVWRDKSLRPKSFLILGLYVLVANAPDLDFIPGIIMGKPNLYHHGISHSIGMGLFCAMIVAIIFNRIFSTPFLKEYLLAFSLYGSHLVLDLISYDGRPPFGIPFFWPFSDGYFMIPILPPVKHSKLDHATIVQFLTDVFSVHNLYVIALEFTFTLPFVVILAWLFRKKGY